MQSPYNMLLECPDKNTGGYEVNQASGIFAVARYLDEGAPHRYKKLLVGLVCAAVSSGCATTQGGKNPLSEPFASEDPCANNARNIGILGGAVLGAILGKQVKHSDLSRVIGATAGAALGGLIGADIDRRRCELSKIAKSNGLDMQVEAISLQKALPLSQGAADQAGAPQGKAENIGLRVAIRDNERQFQSGSAELTPEAKNYFRQIADQYSSVQQQRALKPTASDRKSTRLNSSHIQKSRMPSSA